MYVIDEAYLENLEVLDHIPSILEQYAEQHPTLTLLSVDYCTKIPNSSNYFNIEKDKIKERSLSVKDFIPSRWFWHAL